MHWRKLGLALPAPVDAPWARSHAALAVVDEVDDSRARILFTARDEQGRSTIGRATVDLEPGEKTSVVVEPEPVLTPGALGAFDDSGVSSSCLVEHDGAHYLYYTGWSLGVTVPFYLFAGCAISRDGGTSFERHTAAPLLERSDVDPLLTASPWVLLDDGRWRMWYVSAQEWQSTQTEPRHRYHVRYAESDDGLSWRRDGHVCIDFRDHDEFAISRPCVVKDDDRYRMWFSARGAAYRIGYAESKDGIEWERHDDRAGIDVSPDGWDSEMQAYPVVFDHGGRRYMLYTGNDYGRRGVGAAVLDGD